LTPNARLRHSGSMNADAAPPSFEDALKELERIVGRLEGGDPSLQESIDLFERGQLLRRACIERLDAAQARIEAIRVDGEGLATGTQPFVAG